MNAYLEGLSGEFASRRLPLPAGEFRIGRGSHSDLVLSDARVSRLHATLVLNQGQCQLRDEGSRAGTLVNNTRVQNANLRSGDLIEIKGNVFRFIQEMPPMPAPAYRPANEPDTGPAPAARKSGGGGAAVIMVVLGVVVICALGFYALSSSALKLPGQLLEETFREEVDEIQQEEYVPAKPEQDQWVPAATQAVDPSYGSIAEPYPEFLPSSPVPAGTPIYYDGWSMMVSSEIELGHYENWGISVVVENMGDKARIFRFQNAGVTAKDNLGNIYPPATPRNSNCEAYYHKVKNLEIGSEKMQKIKGFYSSVEFCRHTDGLHSFEGPIPLNASQMIIHFESFGPFSGVDYVIEL